MTLKHHDKAVGKKAASEIPGHDRLREEIEQLAYQFFCQCGQEHGHDLEHWVEAELRVLERYKGKRKADG